VDARVKTIAVSKTGLNSHRVTQDQLETLSEILLQVVEQEPIAGASFLILHKGETVFRKAFEYADLESKRPFTTDELCAVASVFVNFVDRKSKARRGKYR